MDKNVLVKLISVVSCSTFTNKKPIREIIFNTAIQIKTCLQPKTILKCPDSEEPMGNKIQAMSVNIEKNLTEAPSYFDAMILKIGAEQRPMP